ncbi:MULTISPECIES: nuclear transport factor 2 family protein [unclassified Rhodococcus (in: high G+C Gram-positive bacteria)]|uniref:nuclear transport factor 2 family protein n=1 Tax=unclassified Rhodococcus (in: high G+C Gram-positive bacteria) TaxID=192944 RepID=UPI00096AA9B1|nr:MULTISPECIES: nuclear transport factor 2 family protein [unclassified Rhodococcus (in: high G+C Gram-positive bacteria)]
MTTSDEIRQAVTRYLSAAASEGGASIAELYASDATVEDPVGTTPHVGTDAIAAFYDSVHSTARTIELLTLRIAGDTAVFHFRVVTVVNGQTISVEPIDVMTFDDDLRITSMRAVWAPGDIVVT